MAERPIARRAVFFIGGYDPIPARAFFDRLSREIGRFDQTWDTRSSLSPMRETPAGRIGTVDIECEGPCWSTWTEFNFLELNGLVQKDFSRPLALRFGKYIATFADYLLTGTTFRMLASAWRFGVYHLFPFTMLLLFAGASLVLADFVPADEPFFWVLRLIVGITVFSLSLKVLGQQWLVNHLMDLWTFSRNFLHGRRPDAEALLDGWAEMVTARAAQGGFDEILLVGHSTGGALVLELAARCVERDPGFSGRAGHVSLLTLGSTALKIGMHPAAETFREHVQTVVNDGKMKWVEVQCLTDVINFFRVDPVTAMKLSPRPFERFPAIREIRIKHMLEDATYRRIKRNFFRVHYQYIFGNTERYFYDFFLVCCGPGPLTAPMDVGAQGPATSGETIT